MGKVPDRVRRRVGDVGGVPDQQREQHCEAQLSSYSRYGLPGTLIHAVIFNIK